MRFFYIIGKTALNLKSKSTKYFKKKKRVKKIFSTLFSFGNEGGKGSHFPVIILFTSLNLFNASIGVKLFTSIFFISSRI